MKYVIEDPSRSDAAARALQSLDAALDAMEDAWYATLKLKQATYEEQADYAEARSLSKAVFGLFDELRVTMDDHQDRLMAMV